jgi:hypothetical protein
VTALLKSVLSKAIYADASCFKAFLFKAILMHYVDTDNMS